MDPTIEEEACSLCRVLVSVTQSGHVTCTKKLGAGSLLVENMVDMISVSYLLPILSPCSTCFTKGCALKDDCTTNYMNILYNKNNK